MTQKPKTKSRKGAKKDPKQRTLFADGAFRVVIRPESPGSFTVVGPRLPGEPRRTRKSFKSVEKARAEAVESEALYQKHRTAQKSPDRRMASTRLNAKQLSEAESVFELVQNAARAAGRTLTDLVQAGLDTKVVASKPLPELMADFLKQKKDENLAARSLQSLKSNLGRFADEKDLPWKG